MSAAGSARERQTVSPVLFVKNLNYSTTGADLYDVFGRYGAIRQVRIGDGPKTKGTAYIVYEEVSDAKNALDYLNGFHLNSRYIVVLFHIPAKLSAQAELAKREAELERIKQENNIKDSD